MLEVGSVQGILSAAQWNVIEFHTQNAVGRAYEKPNRMVFEFPEPNGKQRYSLGSVQLLENNQLLIGWGAVNETDMEAPQRAVSIVNMAEGKEVFSIDMAPSWLTYRVKAVQP